MTPWDELAAAVHAAPVPTVDVDATAPEPVRRYFAHALGPAPHRAANAAVLEMRGQLKLGRWLPFRARQLLAPRYGTVWRARVGWVVWGSDRFVGASGAMDWRVLGVVPVARAAGDDVSRSSAERAAAESIWVPSAVPPSAATWRAIDDAHLEVRFSVGGHDVSITHVIDDRGALRASSLLRWGDPDETGTWRPVPFGVEVTDERTFDGVTIPSSGRVGWHFGTDRWPDDGEFFRFTITRYELLGRGPSVAER